MTSKSEPNVPSTGRLFQYTLLTNLPFADLLYSISGRSDERQPWLTYFTQKACAMCEAATSMMVALAFFFSGKHRLKLNNPLSEWRPHHCQL